MALLDKDGLSYFWSKIKEKHINKKDNPHDVTKAQVGLGSVLNVASYSKTETDNKLKDYVTKNDLSTKVETQVAKIGDSKVWVGVDNESGFVNIYNVDQGSNAIQWHLDAFNNYFRFVRSGSTTTVPVTITEKGLYGAKYNSTFLWDSGQISGTVSLSDNINNYDWIIMYWVQGGAVGSGTVILTPELIHKTFRSIVPICVSTEKNFVTFSFTSDTTVTVVDANVTAGVVIIGYKGA